MFAIFSLGEGIHEEKRVKKRGEKKMRRRFDESQLPIWTPPWYQHDIEGSIFIKTTWKSYNRPKTQKNDHSMKKYFPKYINEN